VKKKTKRESPSQQCCERRGGGRKETHSPIWVRTGQDRRLMAGFHPRGGKKDGNAAASGLPRSKEGERNPFPVAVYGGEQKKKKNTNPSPTQKKKKITKPSYEAKEEGKMSVVRVSHVVQDDPLRLPENTTGFKRTKRRKFGHRPGGERTSYDTGGSH